jgi:DNA-binding HxlR family transcriptional regulator
MKVRERVEERTRTCLSHREGTMAKTGTPDGALRTAEAPRTPAAHEPLGCRAHEVLARVGDKWSVYIIHVLGEAGTLRFGELRRRVEGISQRMLTVTLRSLERDGLVSRVMYPEVPPRVEYSLTPLAMTLRGIVGELVQWSQANLPEIDAARARYDGQVPGWPR